MAKRCTVILGAGASAGVSLGNYPVDDAWRPPLARELFDTTTHPNYAPILDRYPGALSLSAPLALLAKQSGEFHLEKQLRAFANHGDPATQRNFRQIPLYLRDLFAAICGSYTRHPEGYTLLLRHLLAEEPHEVAFLTLNYDNLLETALGLHDNRFVFNRLDDYIGLDRGAIVVKIHGSINWFVRCGKSSEPWEDCIGQFKLENFAHMPRVMPSMHIEVGGPGRFTEETYWLYPALTAPLAGKGTEAVVCPAPHVDCLTRFLRDCTKFLVIGTSGLDQDVFDLLKSVRECTHLEFVGKGSLNEVVARFRENVPPFAIVADTHAEGFRKFIESGGLERFAKA